MKRQSKSEKQADARIHRIYIKNCSGVQIDIMDIARVFRVGRDFIALHNPTDEQLAERIVAFVQTVRKN
jgi:hypothetical protein